MAAIRGKDTRPEILIRKELFRRGFRYRIHDKKLPGKPDIVLPKYDAVIFVNGCFWHGHGCSLFKVPETRKDFWMEKINKNRDRDARISETLRGTGWREAIVWECAMRGKSKLSIDIIGNFVSDWLLSNSHELTLAESSEKPSAGNIT